jgi:LysR family transcriptional regulator, hydrogen peroxide-inducible genes activator
MITLRQLRYLGALAQHRHFGRAAAACGVTQPALSMQIRDLEAELGVELVERRPGEVLLTEIGAEVVRRSDTLLTAASDLIEYARHRGRPLNGDLRLGVIPTLAPYVLPRILPLVQRRYPGLHIELRETQTRLLLDELARRSLDVVMLALPVDDSELETMRLFEDPFLLALPAGEAASGGNPVSVSAIDPQRLILLEEGHCLRDQALAFCASQRRDATMSLGATSLTTVMQMVANGYGMTLVPQVAIDVEVRDGRIGLARFADPAPGRTIGLAWRRTSPRKADFLALGQLIADALDPADEAPSANGTAVAARQKKTAPRRGAGKAEGSQKEKVRPNR